MGKKEKLHRKKVLARNEKIKAEKKKLQKVYSDYMTSMIEKMKEDDLKVDLKGQELNFEVVEDRVIDNSFQFIPNQSESVKINKEFEPEQDSAGYTVEDREIDVDTDMDGEFVKYEELRNTFPANVEGSKEFNQEITE